ncbi:IS4 family transposase [Lignipirellula cremea]|uniref:Transposase DDE domain protein n=1 Tax=Lignipirellula cremea TaxID=2528010 RepID=A0A518DXW8_9BACT|nr:IS4 family transposase [Lignipirellula cremea]QDU96631.1 Transposase DDE domain protein [Lignipirellula cremea]
MAAKQKRKQKAQKSEQARAAEFDAVFAQLEEIVDLRQADELQPSHAQTIYTSGVVLWLLVLQRLRGGCSMAEAVKALIEQRPDIVPDNKRIEEATLSSSTAAYSRGRSRLSLETVMWLCNAVWRSLVDNAPPTFGGRRVFALDGTTISLGPEWELYDVFPPASNQYGESAWPMAYLVVAHEVESGAALPPEIGAMYGDQAVSETSLIHDHLQRIPADSVILVDTAYGITRVAYEFHTANQRFVVRMKKDRFRRLQKDAELIEQGEDWKTYRGQWTPSRRELRDNPQLPEDFSLPIRLHVFESVHGETIYLATDLTDELDVIADLYSQRWRVETDLSQIKVTLDIENILAKSPEMFRKELMASIVAYNLTIQFRKQAAEQANVPPRRLSFTGVWDVFRIFLLQKTFPDAGAWRTAYARALKYAAREKLPNRPGRSYSRESYKRRSKSSHFKKRSPPWNQPENEPK